MWQRFTERARKVVFHAQDEAQKYGEGYVSTEHILLGMLREPDSVGCRILERLGVARETITQEVERVLPRPEARVSTEMTLTPRAKRVIDLAYDEARELNNNYIGTEHVLLGLIREGDGIAGRVLAKFGLELARTRAEVKSLQSTEGVRMTISSDTGSVGASGYKFNDFQNAGPFWRKCTDPARTAIWEAWTVARNAGKEEIGTRHLLVGLLWTSKTVAEQIRKLGGDPDTLGASLMSEEGPGERPYPGAMRYSESLANLFRSLSGVPVTAGILFIGLCSDGEGKALLEQASIDTADLMQGIVSESE